MADYTVAAILLNDAPFSYHRSTQTIGKEVETMRNKKKKDELKQFILSILAGVLGNMITQLVFKLLG